MLNKLLDVEIMKDDHSEAIYVSILKAASSKLNKINVEDYMANNFPLFRKSLPLHFHNEQMIRTCGLLITLIL
jgi:hypothetical protein